MSEAEVRGLCLKSREIFLQQPILLELEAPLKICGERVGEKREKCEEREGDDDAMSAAVGRREEDAHALVRPSRVKREAENGCTRR